MAPASFQTFPSLYIHISLLQPVASEGIIYSDLYNKYISKGNETQKHFCELVNSCQKE